MNESEIPNEHPNAKMIAFALSLAVLWGGNSVSIKIGLQGVPPLALAGFRFLLALFAVTAWSVSQRVTIRLNRGELVPLILLAVIFVLQIIALNIGTRITSAARSTIMINVFPFFTALFAHYWVPGDRLSFMKTIGIGLAFCGVFITFSPNLQLGAHAHLIGDLIVLISAGLLGFRTVVTKRLIQSIHPYRLLIWLMIFSLPCFFGLSLLLEDQSNYEFSRAVIASILYQGFIVAGVCFVGWTSILKKHSPSKLVVLSFATPFSGIIFSHLLLADELSFSLITGATLVAFGIYLVNRRETV
jgi:drug/metabolite transporter (DMT)-like permease